MTLTPAFQNSDADYVIVSDSDLYEICDVSYVFSVGDQRTQCKSQGTDVPPHFPEFLRAQAPRLEIVDNGAVSALLL